MSYKRGIEVYDLKKLIALREGKECALLVMHNHQFRRIGEHISYVEEIVDRPEGEIATLKLRFAENKVIETKAYIDDTIQEKILVSTWGLFDETPDGIKYYCKGGIQKVITRATDIIKFHIDKTYRMGFAELSKIEVSPVYIEDKDNMEQIVETGLYVYTGDVTAVEEEQKENNVIDTRNPRKRIMFY